MKRKTQLQIYEVERLLVSKNIYRSYIRELRKSWAFKYSNKMVQDLFAKRLVKRKSEKSTSNLKKWPCVVVME